MIDWGTIMKYAVNATAEIDIFISAFKNKVGKTPTDYILKKLNN